MEIVYLSLCFACAIVLWIEMTVFSGGIKLTFWEWVFIIVASIIPIANIGLSIVALANLFDFVEFTNRG